MNEKLWNQEFDGVGAITKVKAYNEQVIATIYSGGSGYQYNKIIPNYEHYDYYEGKWDEYFYD